jgi:hypothetical protein
MAVLSGRIALPIQRAPWHEVRNVLLPSVLNRAAPDAWRPDGFSAGRASIAPHLDVLFFHGSPYAHLTVMRIERLAEAAVATVRWKPFNVRRITLGPRKPRRPFQRTTTFAPTGTRS